MDRRNDRCMHYHDFDKKWTESLLLKHIYSRGLWRIINMSLATIIKHVMAEYWSIKTPMVLARLLVQQLCYLFQGASHPSICQSRTLVVDWLCLDHSLGVVGRNGFFYPIYSPFVYFNFVYWLVIYSWY